MQKAGEVATRAKPWDCQVYCARSRLPTSGAVTITVGLTAIGQAFAQVRAGLGTDFHLHNLTGGKVQHVAKQVVGCLVFNEVQQL